MLSWKIYKNYKDDGTGMRPYGEGACLSTDTKPTGMANGSSLTEMDTKKIYMYDEENEEWRALT